MRLLVILTKGLLVILPLLFFFTYVVLTFDLMVGDETPSVFQRIDSNGGAQQRCFPFVLPYILHRCKTVLTWEIEDYF